MVEETTVHDLSINIQLITCLILENCMHFQCCNLESLSHSTLEIQRDVASGEK